MRGVVLDPDGNVTHDCGTGELVTLTRTDQIVEVQLAGGAGFGDPRARPAALVEQDVAEGIVSPEAAERDYGLASSRQTRRPNNTNLLPSPCGRGQGEAPTICTASSQHCGGTRMSDLATDRPTTAPRASRIHPRFLELGSLLLIAPLCVVGAIIGVQLIVTLGITANTSLIGALAGMALARIPLRAFARYRSVHVQNLAQSAISAATFGAGNALMLPIGIPFVLGRPDLVPALFAGVFLAMLVDGYLLYRMFDSEVFPATAAWPPGAAAAEAIRAGDEGGRKAVVLGVGVIVGIAGNWLIAPGVMSAFGVAFIGNIWALTMFGIGLLMRGYSTLLFNHAWFASFIPGGDIAKAYVPHGMMVGAGIVALIQVASSFCAAAGLHARLRPVPRARRPRCAARSVWAALIYLLIAVVIATLGRTGSAAIGRHAGRLPDLRCIRRTGARADRRPGRDAFRLVPCLRGRADHAGDRHADRLPAGGACAAGRLLRRDRSGLRRHGLRPEGRLHAARLRQRSRRSSATAAASSFSPRCSRSSSPAWWC